MNRAAKTCGHVFGIFVSLMATNTVAQPFFGETAAKATTFGPLLGAAGTANEDAPNGVVVGVEATHGYAFAPLLVLPVLPAFYGGGYASGRYDTHADALRLSLGPEVGIAPIM